MNCFGLKRPTCGVFLELEKLIDDLKNGNLRSKVCSIGSFEGLFLTIWRSK